MPPPPERAELRANVLTVLGALLVVGIGAALLFGLAIYFPRQNRLAATHLPRPSFPRGSEREARRLACRASIDALAAPPTREAFDRILTELTSEACFHGDERAVAYAERVLETFPDGARWASAGALAPGSATARLARRTLLDFNPPRKSPIAYYRTADLSRIAELEVESLSEHGEGLLDVLRSPSVSNVRALRFKDTWLDAERIRALEGAVFAPRLERLTLENANLESDGALLLAKGKFPRLEALGVLFDTIGAEAAGELARAFPALKELDLRGDALEPDAVSAIAAGSNGRLAHVDLALNPIGEQSASLPPPPEGGAALPFAFGRANGAATSRASSPPPDPFPSEVRWMSVTYPASRFDVPTFMRPRAFEEGDAECPTQSTKPGADGRMPKAKRYMLVARDFSIDYLTADAEGCLVTRNVPKRRSLVVGGHLVDVTRGENVTLVERLSRRTEGADSPQFSELSIVIGKRVEAYAWPIAERIVASWTEP